MNKFSRGDRVSIQMPGGSYTGTVYRVMQNYARAGDTRYLIMGDDPVPFETITSARGMRLVQTSEVAE